MQPPSQNPETPQADSQPAPANPPIEAPSVPVPETIVVPAGNDNQTGGVSEGNYPPPQRSGGWIVKILFLLLFLGLIIGGGYWAVTNFLSNGSGGSAGSGGGSITYWGLWETDGIITPLIAEFEAQNPGITVTYVKQSHKQYRERLSASIERGDGPDVFRFHNTWVAMLRSDLALVPADVMSPQTFASAYYPVAQNDLVAGTNIFGIPLMVDGLGLYINEDVFAAAGASPPVTWEDVLSLVPRLTVKNDEMITTSAIALGTTSNVEHWSDILATMMMQNGAKLTNPTGKESEEALLFFRKFADPGDPAYTWNSNLDNSITAFANGRVAMILSPSWRVFDIKQINPSVNFRIAPIPQLPGNTVNWASYWVEGVSAKSRNKDAAWKFLSFLTSRESMQKLYTNASQTRLFGEPYSRLDMASFLAGDRYVEAYVQSAPSAQSFPLASYTHDNGLNDQMIKYLEDAVNSVNSGSSATQALSTASKGFSQILSRYGLVSASAQP